MTRKSSKNQVTISKEERKQYEHAYEKALCEAFEPQWLRETAKETGLIKRERKIDPVAIFWVLIFGFGVELQRTIASLKRRYELESKTTLSDSSWYERFSPELVLFLKACVIHGIEHIAKREHRKLSEKLNDFEDVMIKDSTIIRVYEKLAKIWPAARTRKAAAGVKVSLLVSAVANSVKSVTIYPERTNESKTLRIGPWIKDRILLIDLGFYKHQLFARIEENGGYFVSRLKGTADPLIVGVNSICRGNSIDVVGKHIKEILPKLKRQVLDVEVELTVRRRKYRGKQRMDTARFRLVAIYNEEAKKYHIYLTNISSDKLDAKEIASLYGARWEIELIFKELKSKYSLDIIKTENPHIVVALIWVAILTLLNSRILYNVLRQRAEKEGKQIIRFTHQRWSTIFTENSTRYSDAVLNYTGIELSLMDIHDIQFSQVMDPHVNRKRFTGEWWA